MTTVRDEARTVRRTIAACGERHGSLHCGEMTPLLAPQSTTFQTSGLKK
jgi:hypothetical protein